MEWRVNGSYPSITRDEELAEMGVRFYVQERNSSSDVIRNQITLPTKLIFNATELICIAANEFDTMESQPASLTIAGS